MSGNRFLVGGIALLAGAALASWAAPEAMAAKPKPESISCKFGKKKFKPNLKPSLVASYSAAGGALTMTGNSVKGLTTSFFVLSVGGVGEPSTLTYPQTFAGGNIAYSTGKLGATPKGWTGEGTMTIVLTGYDAALNRITGTFSGTMEPGESTPGGTVTVAKGKLRLDLLQ